MVNVYNVGVKRSEMGQRKLVLVRVLLLVASSFWLSNCSNTIKPKLSGKEILNICLKEKKRAISPETTVNILRSKNRNSVGFSLFFSSAFLKGADPEIVYSECVKQLSG